MNSSLGRFAAAAACVLLPLSAWAQRMDAQVLPAAGSSFVFERQASGSYGSQRTEYLNDVMDIELDGVALIAFHTQQGLLLYRRSGAFVGLADRGGALVATWDPPVDFSWPLLVGKQWKQQGHITFHRQGRSERFEAQLGVEAFEEVTVPAGTFRAWRIRSFEPDGTVGVDWLSPDLGIYVKRLIERAAAHPLGPGRVELLLKWHDIRPR